MSTGASICDTSNLNSGIVSAQITGGTYTYPITFSLFSTSNSAVPLATYIENDTSKVEHSFSNLATGNYFVRVASSCYSVDQNVSISTNVTAPRAIVSDPVICPLSPTTLGAISATNGLYDITWTNDADPNQTVIATGMPVVLSPAATIKYRATFKLKDFLACVNPPVYTSTVDVRVDANPDVSLAVSDIDLCLAPTTKTVTISSSQLGYKYEIVKMDGSSFVPPLSGIGTGGNLAISFPSSFNFAAGTTLRVKTSNGANSKCTDYLTDLVTISQSTPIKTLVVQSTDVCQGFASTIKVKASQSQIVYLIKKNGVPISSIPTQTGNGSDLTFAIPASQLTVGSNTFTVQASNSTCGTIDLDQTAIINVTASPVSNAGTAFIKTCITNPNGKQIGMTAVTGINYSWSPATGLDDSTIANPTANPTTTTTYTLTAADGTCTATCTVKVTVITTVPSVSAGADFTKTCSLNPTGKSIGAVIQGQSATYAWTPTTGLSSATNVTPTANPTATTIYRVTATETSSGCTASDEVNVIVDKSLPNIDAGADFTKTCDSNASGGTIGVSPISGQTYSWSPSTNLSSTTIANPTANPTATTTYTLTATKSATGCTSTDTVVVTVNKTVPVANAGADFTKTCIDNTAGTTIGTISTTGLSYLWSPTTGLSDSTLSNPIANPSETTEYTLTTTNIASGCIETDKVLVTVDRSTIASDAGVDFIKTCATNATGKLIGVTATPGATYSWSPATGLSDALIANPLANPVSPTSYTVTTTKMATGCATTDNVEVTVDITAPSSLTLEGIDHPNCSTNKGIIRINPTGTASDSYSINGVDYQASLVFTDVDPASYNITVKTASNGCTSTAITAVVNPQPPIPTTPLVVVNGATTFCQGGYVDLEGPLAPTGDSYTYQWYTSSGPINDATERVYRAMNAATYTLIVTNSQSCPSQASDGIDVEVNNNPVATINNGVALEFLNCTNTLTLTASQGESYQWTLDDVAIAAPQGTARIFTATTPGSYKVTVTENSGCVATSQPTLLVPPPTIQPTSLETCSGNTIVLNSNVTSFTDPVYQWKKNGVVITGGNNANYSATQEGDYTLQVTERNNSTVTAISCGVSVKVNSLPTVTAGSDFTITCTTNASGRNIGETPETGFSYSWSPSAGLSNASIGNPIATPTSTTTYTVRKTNIATGCWSEDTIVVTVNKMAPNAEAGSDFTKTCGNFTSGKEIGVAEISGVTYSWSPATGLSDASLANPIANPSTTTTYILTTTKTATGCTATDTVVVTVDTSVPVADAGVDFTKTCATNATGKLIGVAAVAGVSYSWSPATGLSDASIANPMANPSATTTYTLTATKTATGCSATDTVIATVTTNSPTVTAGSDFTITCTTNASGRNIGETPETGFSYSWSPSAGLSNASIGNPIATPTSTTTYTVRKTNIATGCWSEDTIVVTVNKMAPNAEAGSDFTKTCGNFTSGKEIGVAEISGVTYSWSPATGLSDASLANPIANPSTTTTYILTTTKTATGCTATDTVVVTVDTSVPVADAGVDFTKTCATNATGKLIGVAAVAGVSYSWSPATGLSDASIANPMANPSATTTYTLTATKTATGCSAIDTVIATVALVPNPVATAVTIENNCPLETVDLVGIQPQVVDGIVYEWWTGTPSARDTQIINTTSYNLSGNVYLWGKTISEGCYNTTALEVAVVITPCCAANVGVITDNNPFYLNHYAPADITILEHTGYSSPSKVIYVLVNDLDGKIKQINDAKPEFLGVLAGNYTVHALVFGTTATPTGIEIGNKLGAIQPLCGSSATFSITVLPYDCISDDSFSQTISNTKQYALLDLTSGNFVQVNTTGEFTAIFTGIPHQIIGFNYTGTASGIVVGGTIASVSASNLDITVGMVFTGCAPVTTQIDGIIYNDLNKNCKEENDTQEGLPINTIYLKLLNSNNEVVQVTSTDAFSYYYFSFSTDLFDGTYTIIIDDNDNMADSVSKYPNSWKGNSQTFTVEFGQIVEYLSNSFNFVPMCMQSATEKPAPKRTPNLQGNTYHFCKGATTSSLSVDAVSGAIVNWYTNATGGDASTIAPIPNTAVVGVKTCYVSQTLNGAESDRTEINIEVHALPEQPTVIAGDDFVGAGTSQTYSVVNASSALSYNWILPSDWTGSSTTKDITVVVGDKSATIGVTATSAYGCVSPIQQLDVRVVIEDDIEVYNSLSPNGDGDNNIFRIRNIDFYPDNILSIYNRWGIEVYRVTSYGQNENFFKGFSDGRSTVSRDIQLPEGTYFYTLTYKNTKGIEKNLSGYLYIKQ